MNLYLLAAALMTLAVSAEIVAAETAEIGDRIVVWGGLNDCPQFPGILRSHLVTEESPQLDFFGLRIQVLGRAADQISDAIEESLLEVSGGGERKEVAVEILKEEGQYLLIRDDVLESHRLLLHCTPPKPPKREPDIRDIWRMIKWKKTA